MDKRHNQGLMEETQMAKTTASGNTGEGKAARHVRVDMGCLPWSEGTSQHPAPGTARRGVLPAGGTELG